MKFNSDDIANQSFNRALFGYNKEHVEDVLGAVARQWDDAHRELETLRDEVGSLHEEVDAQRKELEIFRRRERGLLDAMETAKEIAEDLKRKAEDECVQMLADAQKRVDTMMRQGERKRAEVLDQIQAISDQREDLDQSLRQILGKHLILLDNPTSAPNTPHDTIPRRKPQSTSEIYVPGSTMRITEENIIMESREEDEVDSGSLETLMGMGLEQGVNPPSIYTECL